MLYKYCFLVNIVILLLSSEYRHRRINHILPFRLVVRLRLTIGYGSRNHLNFYVTRVPQGFVWFFLTSTSYILITRILFHIPAWMLTKLVRLKLLKSFVYLVKQNSPSCQPIACNFSKHNIGLKWNTVLISFNDI